MKFSLGDRVKVRPEHFDRSGVLGKGMQHDIFIIKNYADGDIVICDTPLGVHYFSESWIELAVGDKPPPKRPLGYEVKPI